MQKMKRMGSKKSHSWWWDSHISPKNSKWLADNLEEMDKQVKEMLKLIEQEGDSFAKKAEMYYQRRPELVAHVENFYQMYRALAERYDNVTRELRNSIPAQLQSPQDSLSGSDSNSSPEKKTPNKTKIFLGSNKGSSSDRSSSESESESASDENENGNGNGNENENGNGNEIVYVLQRRVTELEEELRETNDKMLILENNLQDFSCEKCEVLEKELLANKYEIECLKGAIENANERYETELANRESEIVNYKQDKSSLEGEIAKLNGNIKQLRAEMENISQEKSILESHVTELEQVLIDLKASSESSNEQFLLEKSDLDSKILILTEVNKNLEANIEQLKMESENQISQLNQEMELHASENKSLEERITNMDLHLHELHLEHAKLITEIEAAKKERERLKGRVKELEGEVERQRVVIVENAEGKREAIRQLCMSLEHYRDGYCQLRKLLLGHKRPLVMAR